MDHWWTGGVRSLLEMRTISLSFLFDMLFDTGFVLGTWGVARGNEKGAEHWRSL